MSTYYLHVRYVVISADQSSEREQENYACVFGFSLIPLKKSQIIRMKTNLETKRNVIYSSKEKEKTITQISMHR